MNLQISSYSVILHEKRSVVNRGGTGRTPEAGMARAKKNSTADFGGGARYLQKNAPFSGGAMAGGVVGKGLFKWVLFRVSM
ncbi:MAG: hypothetical protein ACOX8R_05140 [Bacillota bacterium]|jgi:hypothetical protein